MSLMSLIEDSRGLFRKRRRNKAPVRGKPQPARKAKLSAGRKRARINERMTDGGEREQKARRSGVAGDGQKRDQHDTNSVVSAKTAAEEAKLARIKANKDNERARVGAEPAKSGQPRAETGLHNAIPSMAAQGSCSSVEKAPEKKESNGYDFSDVFKVVEEKKASPQKALIALLPDVPASELLKELEQLKKLIPQHIAADGAGADAS